MLNWTSEQHEYLIKELIIARQNWSKKTTIREYLLLQNVMYPAKLANNQKVSVIKKREMMFVTKACTLDFGVHNIRVLLY